MTLERFTIKAADAIQTAQTQQGTSICLTFDPHPNRLLNPSSSLKMIQSLEQKRERIASLGMDVFLIQPFTLSFSRLEYDIFFRDYLIRMLNPKAIRVGCRFAFGYQRKGDATKLAQLCQKFDVDFQSLPEFRLHDESISSSRIRGLLREGKIEKTNHLLGSPYEIRGQVVAGDSRGKELGYPTANILAENDIILPRGVFVCEIESVENSKKWFGVANFGIRPTFIPNPSKGDGFVAATFKEVFEVHIFDFSEEIYGHRLKIAILSFLRGERTFSDRPSLCRQIEEDCKSAHAALKALSMG